MQLDNDSLIGKVIQYSQVTSFDRGSLLEEVK